MGRWVEVATVMSLKLSLVCICIILLHIQQGSCILCYGPTKGSRCSSSTSTCAIKEDSTGSTVTTQRYCETGEVGCKEVAKVITCYCDSNNCNEDLQSAGWKSGASGQGSGQSSEFRNLGTTLRTGASQVVFTLTGTVLCFTYLFLR